MTHLTDEEAAAYKAQNNRGGEATGHFTGRCGRCGSSDLWDDNLAYGCNFCGGAWTGIEPRLVAGDGGKGRRVAELLGGGGDLTKLLAEILGMACSRHALIAQTLRAGGRAIPPLQEQEKAASILYLLRMYILHGENWWLESSEALRSMAEAHQAKGGAA